MSIEAGSTVLITIEYRNDAGSLVDPTTTSAKVRAPNGTVASIALTALSTGVYTATQVVSSAGLWKCTAIGNGNGVNRVQTMSFSVQTPGAV